jgi:hypothetical protein
MVYCQFVKDRGSGPHTGARNTQLIYHRRNIRYKIKGHNKEFHEPSTTFYTVNTNCYENCLKQWTLGCRAFTVYVMLRYTIEISAKYYGPVWPKYVVEFTWKRGLSSDLSNNRLLRVCVCVCVCVCARIMCSTDAAGPIDPILDRSVIFCRNLFYGGNSVLCILCHKSVKYYKTKLQALSPSANYTHRATAACRRS